MVDTMARYQLHSTWMGDCDRGSSHSGESQSMQPKFPKTAIERKTLGVKHSGILNLYYLYQALRCLSYNVLSEEQVLVLLVLLLPYLHFMEDFYLIAYGNPEGQ